MKKFRLAVWIFAIFSIFNTVFPADTTYMSIMSEEELNRRLLEGMPLKGYGLTVFKGEKPQRFDVEVSGVRYSPDGQLGHTPLAEGELSGGPEGYDLKYIGPFHGISGSPITLYTEQGDKLTAAVRSGDTFDKDANVELQLTQTMIRGAQAFEHDGAYASNGFSSYKQNIHANLSGPFPVSEEINTLFKQRNLQISHYFSDEPMSMVPELQKIELELGSSINVYLAFGDLGLGFNGTVAMVDGNEFYAFAHDIFNTGRTSLPVSKSRVIKVIPNYYSSYRVAQRSSGLIGSIELDCTWGLKGTLGKQAQMIPVTYTIKDREIQEKYNTWIADVRGPRDWIIQTFTYYVLQGGYRKFNMESRSGNGSAEISLEIQTNEFPYVFKLPPYVLTYDRKTVYMEFSKYKEGLLQRVFDLLSNNGFTFRSLSFGIEYFSENKLVELKSAELDTNKAVSGDTVALSMVFYSENNELKKYEISIPLVIPLNVGSGDVEVLINTGDILKLKNNTGLSVFKVLETVSLYNNTRIYVGLDMNNLESFDKDRLVQEYIAIIDSTKWEINRLEQKSIFKHIRFPFDNMAINVNKTLKLHILSEQEAQKQKKQQETKTQLDKKQKIDQYLNQLKIKK